MGTNWAQNKKGPPKCAFAVVEPHVSIGCGGLWADL